MVALPVRELEVLVLRALGLPNQQISARAQTSMITVEWQMKNIVAKLGVGTLVCARELTLVVQASVKPRADKNPACGRSSA